MGERERQRECFESIDSEIVCEREWRRRKCLT